MTLAGPDGLRVGLVTDWITSKGGAEQVVAAAAGLYPYAPIHTLVKQPPRPGERDLFEGRDLRTSFIQRLPLARSRYRAYMPLMPVAIEQFDLDEFDIVISFSHAVAKGVLTRADQLHVSYVNSPVRYAWDLHHQYLREAGLARGVRSALARAALSRLRTWDAASANRADVFIGNSRNVARRIWKVYRRHAHVVYPPVAVERFDPGREREDFFLVTSRLVPYKRVDLVVAAFSQIGLPLVVIGDGPERAKVRAAAGPNVRVIGYQSDEVVRDHMERCAAFVFAAEEDFGIVAVEAQAAGAPVIGFGRGGLLETVDPGRTGILFGEQTVTSLQSAVHQFVGERERYDSRLCRANAEQFTTLRFQHGLEQIVDRAYSRFQEDPSGSLDPPGSVRESTWSSGGIA
jgi:glycosyltransferase involved in cell wall biosynthesis